MSNSNGNSPAAAQQAAPKGFRLLVTLLLQGVKSAMPASTTNVVVAGKAFTVAQLEAELQQMLDLFAAVDQARRAEKAALGALETELPAFKQEVRDLKHAIIALLGSKNPLLAQFGIAVHKQPRALSSQEKAIAAAKGSETRKARHTLGKRAKAEIHGGTPTLTLGPNGAQIVPPEPILGNGQK